MYTRNELEGYRDTILINAVSRTVLKKVSQSFIVYTTAQKPTDGSHYYTPRTQFFVDKMISPGYFKDQFLDTFGPVVYVLQHCRIFFSVFLFIKLIIDVIVMLVRYMETDKITGSTLRFGKTLLSAPYNIFLTTVLTSMNNQRAPVIAAVEHMEVRSCVENGRHEVKEDAKKKEEHLYTAMSPVTLPLLPVYFFLSTLFDFNCLDSQSTESDDLLLVLTDIDFDFPTLTPFNSGTTNCACSNFSFASFNNYPVQTCFA